MGAIHLAKNPATTPNSKHIDIRPHFIRERVANGEFKVVYVWMLGRDLKLTREHLAVAPCTRLTQFP